MYGTPRQFTKGVAAQGAALMIVGCMLAGAFPRPMHSRWHCRTTPSMVDGVEIVCTGIGQDARSDPRWNAYPLKVVLAGESGNISQKPN